MEVETKNECQNLNNCYCHDDSKLNKELERIIDNIAKKEGFTSYRLFVKTVTPDGNNYLGVLTEVTIYDNSSNKELNIFVKSILPGAEDLKMISLSDCYNIEVFAYLELSVLLDKLQTDAKVPVEERYKLVKSYSDSTTEHIVMDNMIKKGYSTWNRFDIISLELAEVAVKLLAKFHALGFVIQEKQPKYFEEKIITLKHPADSEELDTFATNMANKCLEYLESSARMKLEKVLPDLIAKASAYTRDRDTILTLCHGDFRANNMLIKIVEGELTDLVPVDYQILNYGPPLIDLIYFIFGGTDREFRRQHLEDLKNLYYDTMKSFLKYFDMNVQKYFPKEEYERLYKEKLDFGLSVGIWYYQLNLATEDNIVDLSKSQLSDADFGKNDLSKIRIQELVDEFIEWGYL